MWHPLIIFDDELTCLKTAETMDQILRLHNVLHRWLASIENSVTSLITSLINHGVGETVAGNIEE